jgi:hypothetical protein
MLLQRLVWLASARSGSPSSRMDSVEACITYTLAMVEAENVCHSRGLIAVSLCDDPWFRVTRDTVQEALGKWLGIPRRDIEVDFFPPKGFLLLLPSLDLRDWALSCNDDVSIGRAKLQLLPWARLVGTEATKLSFKVRL